MEPLMKMLDDHDGGSLMMGFVAFLETEENAWMREGCSERTAFNNLGSGHALS